MEATIITGIRVRKVLNGQGKETIEVEVATQKAVGRFSPPTGKSRGKHEVVDFPKGGVDAAVEKARELIIPKLMGRDSSKQTEVDSLLHEIDGTVDFSSIGGNTAYAFSMAVAEAAAKSLAKPLFLHLGRGKKPSFLPILLSNMISGGKHALRGGCTFQEFLAIPTRAKTIFDVLTANLRVREVVRHHLEGRASFLGGVSIEGAWIVNFNDEETLNVLVQACDEVSGELGTRVKVGIDVAASSFWDGKHGVYLYKDGSKLSPEDHAAFMFNLIDKYSLVYVEDAFHEEDFENFSKLTQETSGCLICGDDLFTTNVNRLRKGIEMGACNSIIIKPNQVGTITDARLTVEGALEANYVPVVSHRSGESCDPHLAHLAVAFACPLMKISITGGERVLKVNELIRIAELTNPIVGFP
jgi:enolase